MATISIGGYTPAQVVDVETSAAGGSGLGSATIQMVATSANRSNISAGDDVDITRSSGSWSGYVTGRRRTGDDLLEVQAIEQRLELKHEQLHQVFYNVDSGAAVRRAVTKRAQALSLTAIHTGDDPSTWSSNAPEAELYAGARAGLYNWGTDLFFVGARAGHSGTLTATYESVPAAAIEDGIFELQTRLLVNDTGGIWDTEIELTTPDGTTYLWDDIDVGPGFERLVLRAEEASPDGQVDRTGTLQYRFTPSARLAENTGIMIDNAHTIPFRLIDRTTAIDVSNVQDTGRNIIRRADVTAGQFISQLATEDAHDWWVDDGALYYQPAGDASSLEIAAGTTQVFDVDADRDFESIRNVVTVVGADDIEVTVSNQSSIAFYGPNARSEPIVDETLTTEAEARARAEGYLEDHAFDDSSITFRIVGEEYAALSHDDDLPVTWPPLDLAGTFSVDSATVANGVSAVSITASSA